MAMLSLDKRYSHKVSHLSKTNYYQRKPLKRVRLFAWCYFYHASIKTYLHYFEQLNLLWLIESHPLYIEKPLKPYGCLIWSFQQRMSYLLDHFYFVQSKLGSLLQQIYSRQGLVLFDFQDRQGRDYAIKLYEGEEREGSLGIILTNHLNQNIYSLSFTIYENDKLCLHVGNVQGANDSVENRSKVIVELTRTCFGLRPKALILEVLLMFARHWQIEQLTSVSNKGHIYQALRYTGSKKQSCRFNYDQFWKEYEAILLNKYLYQIPTSPKRKCLDALTTSKRSLYKKRYQWLETLNQQISTLTK